MTRLGPRFGLALLALTVLLTSASSLGANTRNSTSRKRALKKQKYPIGGSYPSGDKLKVAKDLPQQLAKWKYVQMPLTGQGLSSKEVKLVNKLVEAARYLDYIFWRQSDPEALTLYQQLEGSKNPRDQQILKMLFINGSRFDLIDENKPFVGAQMMPPGRGLYPQSLTREEIEKYVIAHPEKKDELYSQFTVVRRRGNDLDGLQYHVAYRAFLDPAAKALREAAALSDDKPFADFLRLRADALMTDDFYKSDLAWVELKDPKFDIIFAPYETYLDDLMGIKGSYGAAVLIRNAAESKKLAAFEQYVPDIQEALPLPAEDKPSKKGQPSPMEVMDAPYRSGDLLHGYQAVADNLPNDPRIHQEKGTKKIFFKNFMDARVNSVVLPVARKVMRTDQAANATADGYLTNVMMHEISHGIGPAFARTRDGQKDIREAIGPVFSALEEAKADVTGMFGLKWLVDKGVLPKERLNEFYASYVAGIFRSVRFGVGEPHGRAQMMEFNFLAEKGAITRTTASTRTHTSRSATAPVRYAIDYERIPVVLAELSKELLETEATGDRERAEKWFSKYDKMPDELRSALNSARGVPVDVFPVFSFPQTVQ